MENSADTWQIEPPEDWEVYEPAPDARKAPKPWKVTPPDPSAWNKPIEPWKVDPLTPEDWDKLARRLRTKQRRNSKAVARTKGRSR